ncbi:DUF998 domain-containing protein [Solitalea lacus]|uniref:DUF998 domain-containing protein n=1 Tax=Solitalea lacus TaxID=2911172 RepID=UPI001EDAFF09|nr:DUF998 domain-containing protein [Solitalea lacus]UKJ06208.1 DUF998 domain-containing protein [Solitalea lacus]
MKKVNKTTQVEIQSKWQQIILLIILGYEAAGALLGGILLIAGPDGHLMDMPVGIMNGVFRNFLVPGIILLGLGILNSFAFVSVIHRATADWFMSGFALGGLFIWFVVEIIILQELHWLHAMWGIPVLLGWMVAIPLIASRNATGPKALLICGILSSIWYIAINIYVPLKYEGYNMASYTVSELSAIGAPTRVLWVLLCLLYSLLFAAFGWGVLQVAKENYHLRLVGYLILAYCIFGFYWPPMHMRGNEPNLSDTLHIVWAIVTNIFMWLFMGFGAATLGKQFRIYTIISIILHIIFGILTFSEAPNIAINSPTPMIGNWERINIGIFMIWVIMLAIVLLRRENRLVEKI